MSAYYLVKLLISAALIVLVSEVAKRYTMFAGLLASLPLVSYLGMIWLYADTKDVKKVADLSSHIFWLVLPSLILFIALPLLLKKWDFLPSLVSATLIMFAGYLVMILALRRFGMIF